MRNKERASSNNETNENMVYDDGHLTATLTEEHETDLNLFPDLILDDSNGNLTILIKHDYYSSDSDHGRELLGAFLDVLVDEFSKVSRIFLIDSGVKLLDPSNPLYNAFKTLLDMEFCIASCRESLDAYKIEFEKSDRKDILSMHEIALELMSAPYLFTLA